MAFTVPLVCRNPRHDHGARLLSRWNDARGAWSPLPAWWRPLGEGVALIWEPSDEHEYGEVHLSYEFACGARVTQARLHSLLDEARALGNPEVTLIGAPEGVPIG